MGPQKRRRLYCEKCEKITWCKVRAPWDRNNTDCQECGSYVHAASSALKLSDIRRKARTEKAKMLGTYESKNAKKERRAAQRRELSPKYVWWIHGWPCLVPACRKFPVVAHHVRSRGALGSDLTCVPLCPDHHNMSPVGVHNMGMKSFQLAHGVNLDAEVEKFNQLFAENRPGPYQHTLPAPEKAGFEPS